MWVKGRCMIVEHNTECGDAVSAGGVFSCSATAETAEFNPHEIICNLDNVNRNVWPREDGLLE